MTIIEALQESKANDNRAYIRETGVTWIRWQDAFTYKLTGEDLLATDWEPLAGHSFGSGNRYVATGEVL